MCGGGGRPVDPGESVTRTLGPGRRTCWAWAWGSMPPPRERPAPAAQSSLLAFLATEE